MLQRAASNAYSWWLASHIRTKQSKWLEQNLQDMEEKVSAVLKLIEEDGDSFRKRAEMYYKKRPELIGFVQESFRAYRALAERYDHISTELQNANNTLASCFPDQVAIPMEDDDDDDPSPRFRRKPIEMPMPKPENIPKVPNGPTPSRDFKGIVNTATKKLQAQAEKANATPVIKSGLSKDEGLAKIDKLQKRILALQTEKEFMKSSYESGLNRYYEIDKEIVEVQNKVGRLQDEFGNGDVIEDDEARALMAAAALKSCHETLTQLQEKHERSAEEAEVERKKIKDSWQKLRSMRQELISDGKPSEDDNKTVEKEEKEKSKRSDDETKEKVDAQREKIKEHFEIEFSEPLDVSEMAEKIDELVSKVVSLETAISSQTALVSRLKTESDELQVQIQMLEDDKANLVDDKSTLSKKLKEMEEKLRALEALNQNLEDQNNNLQTHFTEAQCNYEHLSEKLQDVKPDAVEAVDSSTGSNSSQVEGKIKGPNVAMIAKEFDEQENDIKKSGEEENDDKSLMSKESRVSATNEQNAEEMVEVSDSSVKESSDDVSTKDPEVKMEEKTHEANRSEAESADGSEAKMEGTNAASRSEAKSADGPEVKMEGTNHAANRSEAESADGSEVKTEVTNHAATRSEAESADGSEVKTEGTNHAATRSEAESADGPEVKMKGTNHAATRSEAESADGPEVKMEGTNHAAARSEVESTERKVKKRSKPSLGEMLLGNVDPKELSKEKDSPASLESVGKEKTEEGEPDWKQMFMNGIDDREKALLGEYTAVLRNLKDMKKKFSQLETDKRNSIFEFTLQLKELKSSNAMKDEEIRSLRQRLSLSQAAMAENNRSESDSNDGQRAAPSDEESVNAGNERIPDEKEGKEEKMIFIDQPQTISPIEEKFRMSIDELLEENLNYWLRFSSAFGSVQNFDTSVKDLFSEVSKLEERMKQEGSSHARYSVKSDVKPLYKHLREIQTELTVWLEKSVLLKKELKNRLASLNRVQEEITKALKDSAEDEEFKFTSYQAAKFQGEVLNMKQENNKVADELQAGLDHVTTLQLEVERALAKLNEDFGLNEGSHRPGQLQHSESRSRVPLRSFIFGVKPKKQRSSFFSLVHPLNKKYNGLKTGK